MIISSDFELKKKYCTEPTWHSISATVAYSKWLWHVTYLQHILFIAFYSNWHRFILYPIAQPVLVSYFKIVLSTKLFLSISFKSVLKIPHAVHGIVQSKLPIISVRNRENHKLKLNCKNWYQINKDKAIKYNVLSEMKY